jgi:ERCC4-type nuclease
VVIDTREQRQFSFSDAVDTVVATLHTGDYSLYGQDDHVTIERKSLDDLVGCLTRDRDRFERELSRMATFDLRVVLIEASLADVRDHRYTSRAHPSAVFGSTICLHVDYGVPFLWCHDHAIAGRVCERMLCRYAQNLVRRAQGDATNASDSQPDIPEAT